MNKVNLFAQSSPPDLTAAEVKKLSDLFPEMFKVIPPISPNQDDNRHMDAPTLPFVATNTGD